MLQYLVVLVALLSHHGGTYLAEAYAVPPSGSGQDEAGGDAFGRQVFAIDDKRRTVEVRGRKRAPYHQFLADDARLLRAHNLQLPDASAGAAGYGDEVDDLPVVHSRAALDEGRKLLLRVFYPPAVEVSRFLVVVVEHLLQDALVGGVAEGIGRGANPAFGFGLHGEVGQVGSGHRRIALRHAPVALFAQVGLGRVFPTVLKLLERAAAALGVAGVAQASSAGQHLSACVGYSLPRLFGDGSRQSLVALAVVVGADVVERVMPHPRPLSQGEGGVEVVEMIFRKRE